MAALLNKFNLKGYKSYYNTNSNSIMKFNKLMGGYALHKSISHGSIVFYWLGSTD